ncbi:MAG: glycosyltransferase, partial [Rikenellaceae bacterium]
MSVVSVIAPCRNEEKFVKAFLDNMLSQDFPKDQLEIFVVDGNSVDNTQKFINEYSEKYSFIKLLINERQTVPFALNKATPPPATIPSST